MSKDKTAKDGPKTGAEELPPPFDGDTDATGARRTLLVTSLDNDEVAAGNAVSLGDTHVTATDDDGLFSGTITLYHCAVDIIDTTHKQMPKQTSI